MKTIHVVRDIESGYCQAASCLEKANQLAIKHLKLYETPSPFTGITFNDACIAHLKFADCEIDYHQRVACWIEDNYRIQILEIPYYD